MPNRITALRLSAILFALGITAADGWNSIAQALADGWTPDTVVVVAIAVLYVNLAPTYAATAWARGNLAVVALLVVPFIPAAGASWALTLKRVGSQIAAQQHETERANYPAAQIAAQIAQAEARADKVAAQIVAKMSQVKGADITVQVADHPPIPTQRDASPAPLVRVALPQYMQARVDQGRYSAELAGLEQQRDRLAADLKTLRDRELALGPPQRDVYGGLGDLIAYALACLAMPAAAALFLFASTQPTARELASLTLVNASSDVTQHHATSNNITQHHRDVNPVDHCDVTADIQPEKSPGNRDAPTSNADADLMLRDVACCSVMLPQGPKPPRKVDGATQADVVRDILKETIKRASDRREQPDFARHAPKWQECQRRYGYASATITKYRRAAQKQFERVQRQRAAAYT